MNTSNIITILGIPKKTASGPAWDFAEAIQRELGSYRENQLYRFKDTVVRLFSQGRKLGADFYRPVRSSKVPGTYSVTRITSTGKRIEMGFAEIRETAEPLALPK